MNPVVHGYLSVYNLSLVVGWSYCMYLTILSKDDFSTMWRKVEIPLKISQTAALVEIVHVAIGIVKSNLIITIGQVFSRVFVVWAVLHISPLAQTSIGLPALLVAWNATEIIRYAYYFLNPFGMALPVQWLRYSLFIVLYPFGLYGELASIYAALNDTKRIDLLGISNHLPEALNAVFNYQNIVTVIALLYLPLFPKWYLHMLSQRRKILRGEDNKTTKKKSN